MFHELGRAIRTAWAINIWGERAIAAASHLDFGSTVVLIDEIGCFWWLLAPSMN